jgi:hypothetical protein
MNISAIIEVAIGIVFIWIVLSLSTIQIQEWFNARLQKRAHELERSIRGMLTDPNLTASFYDHPIIRGMTEVNGRKPAYIPAKQFAVTLFDIAATAGTEASLIQRELYSVRREVEAAKDKTKRQAAGQALEALFTLARGAAASESGTAITNSTTALLKQKVEEFGAGHPEYGPAIKSALKQAEDHKGEIEALFAKQNLPKGGDDAVDQLRRGIAALGVISPHLNQALTPHLANIEKYAAEKDSKIGLARKNVETWFDDSMDRLSGAFKRNAQAWAFGIGLFLAVVMNVDSVALAVHLWRDPSIRQVLATKASRFDLPEGEIQSDPDQAMRDFTKQFEGINLPLGWTLKAGNGPVVYDPDCQLFPGPEQTFGIPSVNNSCITPFAPDGSTNILLKILGIFLSGLAARQGAPYWFDFLKRMVNVRSTGSNPAEQKAEGLV